MYFVSGVTGQVGGAAAHRLLEGGHAVRSLSRDPNRAQAWSHRGVELRGGGFTDAGAVADALDGVRGAFLMLPPLTAPAPGFPEATAVIESLRRALRQAPPPRVVALSSVGSQRESGLGNITTTHLLERALGELGVPTAFLRAGSFLENYTYGLDAAAATGVFDTYLTPTDRTVPMVGTADIGNEVARLLVEGWAGKKIIELGSRVSPDDLALALSAVLDRSVQARSIPRERWAASLEAIGMAPGTTGPFEQMADALNSGWIDFGVPGTEPVPATTTPAEFFEQARKARRIPPS